MSALRHSCRSPRSASLRVALCMALFFCIGCVRGNGCEASAPEGSRTEDAKEGPRQRQKGSDRVVASFSGSRAIRVLDERCEPRVVGGDPGPTGPATAHTRLPGKPVAKADECVRHADCVARPHGRCVAREEHETFYHSTSIVVPAHTECLYDECTSDAECRERGENEPRADLVCRCDAKERHTCTFANCRTDADCPAPFACGSYQYCHSAADECQKPSDCTGGRACTYSWEKKSYLCVAPQAPMPG